MLIKGDHTILYRRGNYAAVLINRTGEYHVVDLSVKCPKRRLWSLAEFPTDAEATRYCRDLWADSLVGTRKRALSQEA